MPPSDERLHLWAEKRIDLTGISPIDGPYRTDITPMVVPVYDALQSRDTKEVVVMCSAQVGKSQTLMCFAAWAICESPGPTFWVGASEESVEEFLKARLLPMFERIPDVMRRMPTVRSDKTLNLIQFSTMPIYFRGANSPSKLRSTPVRWMIGDEIDAWRPGSLDAVLKRVRSYQNSKRILISTPIDAGGDMHAHWLNGTQSFFHFACPQCGHRQPFRFGREKSILFPESRVQGGFLWNVNDETRPGGKWNWAELRKTVRYQCESCPAEFTQSEQFKLLQTLQRVDTNPTPEPGIESFAYWSAYSLLVKWPDIVCEFIVAKERAENGDLEALKSFVRETLGEPWTTIGETADESELRKLCGNYTRGEFWPADARRTTRILAVDVQKDHLRFILCQLREGGEMRVVDYGRPSNFDDLRALQEKFGVANRGVFIDSADGNRQTEILRECAKYSWIAMRGSAQESFVHKLANGKTIARPYRVSSVDPFQGTAKANRHGVTRIEWGNGPYKDRVYLYALKGKGPRLELPSDSGAEWLAELQDERRVSEKNARGATVWKWRDSGNNHAGDCLLMATVAMDVSSYSRGTTPPELANQGS